MPTAVSVPSMQDLLEAGVHFGHQTRRGDPRMQEYVFGARGGVHIVNLEETEKKLKEAAEFVYDLGKQGKVILFVGTKKQAQPLIKESAEKAGAPYVITKWIPGLLTNFEEMRRRVKKLTDLKEEQAKGQLTRYTKKEQLLISKKLDKFERNWGGIVNMEKLPDAIFVADAVGERIAVSEGNKIGLFTIGIADTNSNPMTLTHPIPGNDDATKALKIFIETIGNAYGAGLSGTKAKKSDDQKDDAKKNEEKTEETIDAPIAEEVAAVEEEIEKKIVEESSREV